MKIALVSAFPPTVCGIASYTAYLTESLRATGAEVSIVALDTGVPPDLHRPDAVCVQGDYVEALARRIFACEPDIVHIQHEYGIWGTDERFPQLLRRLRARRLPTAVTLHTVHTSLTQSTGCASRETRRRVPDGRIEDYQARIGEESDCLIVHQDHPIRQVLLRQGVAPDRVHAIPHGTKVEKTRSASQAKRVRGLSDAPLIVAFGYFTPSKNPLQLLKAFARIKQEGSCAKLWLSGFVREPTPETLACWDTCQETIRRNRLEGEVTFHSALVAEDELSTLLAAADVVSMAYDEDTYSSSGALHLAIGAGCAVVASRIPKFQELETVADEVLVDPRSVSELSSVLDRSLTDRNFRASVRERLRHYASQTAWPIVAGQHLSIYNELIPERIPVSAASYR